MEFGLKGKRAIVTGASRGIGLACAVELAKEGARVCATARSADLLERAVGEINAAGGEGMSVPADLTSLDECKKVVYAAAEKFGGLDILVNVAAAPASGSGTQSVSGSDVLDIDTSLIDSSLGVKTYGYIRLSQLVVPYMKKNGWGRIIHVAGASGTNPTRANLQTSFACITVLNFTRALSDAVAADGIVVNTVSPGMTRTERAVEFFEAISGESGKSVDELIAERGASLPAGRVGEPEEVGRMVCFLASEANSYSFGSSIYMDGGSRRGTP